MHINGATKREDGGGSEIHGTTVTPADEFVWIDSYNRLVELQKFPWNHTDLCSVIASARKDSLAQTDPDSFFLNNLDILPRLSYYLQRALVRIAREAQRLSRQVGKCGRQEVRCLFMSSASG